jgi:hypothetical protein
MYIVKKEGNVGSELENHGALHPSKISKKTGHRTSPQTDSTHRQIRQENTLPPTSVFQV